MIGGLNCLVGKAAQEYYCDGWSRHLHISGHTRLQVSLFFGLTTGTNSTCVI
jgi:hypothetical protein